MKRDFDAAGMLELLRTGLTPIAQLFAEELIVDNFAGGGGTSTGLEMAFGRPVDIAINHDPEALAMHALNHPYTLHLCEDVWEIDPLHVTNNRPVGLVWLSPDCKHFSKAKGATPVEKRIRGLAWVTLRWAAKCKPRVIMLENVEEFQEWGPLVVDAEGKARPDPAKKGKTFESFVRQLRAHGYAVEFQELRACDNGAPTIRKRFFMVARRDGLPIVFPEPTHGKPGSKGVLSGKLQPWRTAAECIDFDEPAVSIFGRKKDLAFNTRRRVAKGAWRHVLTNPKPFIVGVGGRMGQSPERSVDLPLQTITSKADSCVAQPVLAPLAAQRDDTSDEVLSASDKRFFRTARAFEDAVRAEESGSDGSARPAPFIVGAGGPTYSGKPVGTDQPFGALTSENHRAVAQPVLAPLVTTNTTGHSGAGIEEPIPTIATGGHHALTNVALAPFIGDQSRPENHTTASAAEPLRTICAQVKGGHFNVIAPAMVPLRGTSESHLGNAHSVEEPVGTISAGGTHHGLAAAHLVTIGYGERAGQEGTRTHPIEQPLGTVVSGGIKQALAAAHLVDMGHGESCSTGAVRWGKGTRDIEQPLNTVTASSSPSAVAAIHLTHLTHHGDRRGTEVTEPLPTITGAHRGEQVMVAAYFEQANGGFYTGEGRSAEAPLSTVTAAGSNQQLVTAYFIKYYSSGGQWQAADAPIHTLPTKARMGLVQVIQVPLEALAPEYRVRAKQCADLLHEHLPEHFPEPADMVIMGNWVLVDITLRMLKPPELYRAQGFPRGYLHTEIPDPKLLFTHGRQVSQDPRTLPRIPLTVTAQVRMCGNSVSPVQAHALAAGNFAHERRSVRQPHRARRTAR